VLIRGKTVFRVTTHSLEISMNYAAGVEEVKAFGDIRYLIAGVNAGSKAVEETPTRASRSASGCFLMYSVRLPPGIRSEMSWRGLGVIPRRGTMFLCFKHFHITASWQSVYESRQHQHTGKAMASMTHFRGFPHVLGLRPSAFDANPRTIESPLVYITRTV
jgi:hypothetical protein